VAAGVPDVDRALALVLDPRRVVLDDVDPVTTARLLAQATAMHFEPPSTVFSGAADTWTDW
jgi:hypothetical protein